MKTKQSSADKNGNGRYHCVQLVPGPNACDAIKELTNQKYLSDDAPFLPLEGCNQARCRCIYSHLNDRREGDRRSPGAPRAAANERRKLRDRRSNHDADSAWPQVPDEDDVRNRARVLSNIVDRLLSGDDTVTLDDYYSAQQRLQESVEWKLLTDQIRV